MTDDLTPTDRLAKALRRIYDRPQPPAPWRDGANLPWDDPVFSERMLAQHLDPSHGAARQMRPMRFGETRYRREVRVSILAKSGSRSLSLGSTLFYLPEKQSPSAIRITA